MNEKKERFVSPLGEAMYAFTSKPDTQFKADGTYRIDLVVDKVDDSVFLKELAKDTTTNAGKGAKKPFKMQLERETEEETGKVVVKFKSSFAPAVFDYTGRKLNAAEIVIGNGSKVKICYTKNYYEGFGGGMNLYLQGIQIMELVEYTPVGAESYGFEVSEDVSVDLEEDGDMF